MRFYRFNLGTSDDYEAMRAAVDTALGYSGGVTCIQPYASAPQDSKGRVLLSINPSTPGYSLLVLQLNALLVASKVRELDQNWYEFSMEPVVTGGGGSSAWGDITGTPTTLAGYGITDGVLTSDSRLSDARTPTSHVHGNITNAGAIGTTPGQIVVTTTSGVLATVATISAATQVSGLAAIATSGSGGDLTSASVTNSRLANVSAATIKGRTSAGTGSPEDLTGAQATALLDAFTSTAKGLVPASGGGTTTYLRADGTFATPPSGSGLVEEEFTVSAGASGYTGSGTSGSPYTRTSGVPAGAKMVVIQAHAAGGGGGGGYRRASGAAGAGGGGGGAGAVFVRFVDVAGLDGQTVTVQVGAGGAGGAGGDGANATAGSAGTGGGDVLVRIGTTPRYWLAVGGGGGGGGTAATGTAGTAGGNTEFGGVGGSASSITAAPANVTPSGPNCTGGGAGGGCSAANAQFAGGFVNSPRAPLLVFGNETTATNSGNAAAGTAGGGAGGSGGAGCGGGGGGGNATGAGGAGASGGDYGGGGGGGGCGTGAAGGSGGNGAPGFVRIAWIF